MAEIRVAPTSGGRSRAWLWLLILLVLIAAVVYWLYASGNLRLGSTGNTRTDSTHIDSTHTGATATSPARSGT
jgi:hypothetical protein